LPASPQSVQVVVSSFRIARLVTASQPRIVSPTANAMPNAICSRLAWPSAVMSAGPRTAAAHDAQRRDGGPQRSHPLADGVGGVQESIEAVLHSLRVNEDGSLTQRLPPAQREAIMRSIWNDPPARWFSSVKVPAMLMPAIPRPERRWEFLFTRMNACVGPAASALSGATVRGYLGGGHDLHAQHPDRVAADLLSPANQVRAG
jgi:hypothetical protein